MKQIIYKWKNLSRKKRSYITALVTIVGLLLWAFISAGIITHNFNRSQVAQGQNRKEALINGIILTETKDEMKYWEIYGEKGTYDSKNEVAMLSNVLGNFYKDNEVSMSFQSSRGTYNSVKKQITLYDDTFIVIQDGTTLEADRLVWNGSDEPVIATGKVRITRENRLLTLADKVEISPDYSHFKITGNTISKIYETKEKQ